LRTLIRITAGLALSLALAAPAFAEVSELRVTHQPGLAYLPLIIMEHEKLVEKEAQKHGLGDLKVSWITFNSGGASADALLSGNVDLVTSGSTNLLLLWDKTGGQVKGVAAAAAIPMLLLTRNPNVKSLKDFGPSDKIAVPTVRVSTQATVLQLAAEKTFGPSDTHKLDPLTVALGHPDAFIALASGKDVDSHFSLPPYQEQELKIPGVHAVVSSVDIVGGPASNGVVFGTTKFHDANPKTIAAFDAALQDAETLIAKDKRKAAEIYLSETKDKLSVDQLVAILNEPNFVYSSQPHATLKLADLMVRAGTLKTKPASWKDYFFPEISNGPGD
jgi:NitT/TauT family transport system substrate-binding protein